MHPIDSSDPRSPRPRPDVTVLRLTAADAERYARLRMRMLRESPWAFGSSPETDVAADRVRLAERMAAPEQALFAVEADAGAAPRTLVAAAGLLRATAPKAAHRARVWGVYVAPEHRRRGLGRAVMEALLHHARGVPGLAWLDLSVSAAAPAAQRLYADLGFTAWGREADALRVDGRGHDEIHMALRLVSAE